MGRNSRLPSDRLAASPRRRWSAWLKMLKLTLRRTRRSARPSRFATRQTRLSTTRRRIWTSTKRTCRRRFRTTCRPRLWSWNSCESGRGGGRGAPSRGAEFEDKKKDEEKEKKD